MIQTDLGTALRMPEPEIRHTTSAQPTRMIRFHVGREIVGLIGRQSRRRHPTTGGSRDAEPLLAHNRLTSRRKLHG
jgi:hypothetical protein